MIVNNQNEILRFSSNSTKIKNITYQILTLLQNHPRGDFVVSMGVLWLMLCERFDVNPVDILTIAERMRNETFENKYDSQFRALQEYLKHEI